MFFFSPGGKLHGRFIVRVDTVYAVMARYKMTVRTVPGPGINVNDLFDEDNDFHRTPF
jgi:hypothetical protein